MANDKTPAIKKKTEMQEYSISNANSLLGMASELSNFIRQNKLLSNIKGKEFVNVEAWTFAGMSMGLTPVITELLDLSTPEEIKYRATVEVVNLHTNQVISRGIALCSNKESSKKYFEEYAIASMAQTRATGKAYRLPLGWLIKAAGFEPTPAEEMDFQTAEVVETKQPKQAAPTQPAAPVMEVKHELADQSIRDSLLLNLEGFKGLYTEAELTKGKAGVNALTADSADTVKRQLQDGILKRIQKKRPELNHSTTPAQLDLIDQMLLSHLFTADEKAAFNTSSYEYDNIDGANRVAELTAKMKERNPKATAA